MRNPFVETLDDVRAAQATLDRIGRLTGPVFSGIRRWFADVYLEMPIGVFDFDEETRTRLTATVLSEMESAFAAVGVETDEASLERLAAETDPLWRELASLYGHALNAEWETIRPGSTEELLERVERRFRHSRTGDPLNKNR